MRAPASVGKGKGQELDIRQWRRAMAVIVQAKAMKSNLVTVSGVKVG